MGFPRLDRFAAVAHLPLREIAMQTRLLVLAALMAATVSAQEPRTLPRLLSFEIPAQRHTVQSGGIVAYDLKLDEKGAVTSAEIVQDVAPYGAVLGATVRSWRFEPAREGGRAVPSRVLLLGFFRPPALTFAAPANPRYKTTVAPDEIPWPTSVAVPPYPPNALGGGMVVMEADVSDGGAVTGTRVLSTAGAFDGAATEAVKKWVFRPARRGPRDVPSRVVMAVSFVGTSQ